MATQITATLPTLDFPREVDYLTQEDWAAFSSAAEENFGILGGDWSTQMQLWKDQANAMSIESNNNSDLAQSIANYQGDWTSQGYTLGQTVSVSGVYYICKLTHITGQNPTTGGSLYWNIALGNWNLKVNNYGNETIAGVKTFSNNIIGNITGNAAGNSGTTTKLYIPVTINGVLFDGSANIMVEDSTKVALEAFTGANVRLSINGYQKLPSGLIIQWGSTSSNGVGYSDFTYPIAFPNSVLTIIPTSFIGGGAARHTVTLDSNESNYHKARVSCWFGDYLSSLEGQIGVNWLVIGY